MGKIHTYFSKPFVAIKKHFKVNRSSKKNKKVKVPKDIEDKIIETVTEFYKFNGTFNRMLSRVPNYETQRYLSKYLWVKKKITELADSIEIQINDFTGMDFDPGLPISVLNIDEFEADDELVISQMLEPVILKSGKLLKSGTALVEVKQ